MIEHVEIEGFRSFGSPGTIVDLHRLNFIVGPNACGKTNFAAALQFLHNCIQQNVEFAVNELGGSSEVRNKVQRERKTPKPLRMRVKLSTDVRFTPPSPNGAGGEVQITSFDYSLAVNLRGENATPIVQEERLTAAIETTDGEKTYSLVRDAEQLRICDPFPLNPTGDQTQNLQVPKQEKSRPAVNVGFFSLPAVIFKSQIEQWSFYNISPRVARQPYKELPDTVLGSYGENLAVVLHELEMGSNKNGKSEIVAALRGVIPGLLDINTQKDGFEGKWALTLEEDKIRGRIPPSGISDGTVRLIALMTIAVLGAKRRSTVVIEEPENGIHPHLAEHLVTLFRDKTKDAQFIITTHNPSLLDYATPEEVLMCGKTDGLTKIRRASDLSEIKSFQRRFSLGDLWVQGTFDQLLEDTQ